MNRRVEFDVLGHVKEQFAGPLQLDAANLQQPYPDKIVGTADHGETHVAILIKPVGPEHASQFRRWVTYGKGDFDGMLAGRPNGWAYYVLMVGLLPDGTPWWTALYDEDLIRRQAGFAEPMKGGRFYRFDPNLVMPALVGWHDFLEPKDVIRDPLAVVEVYRCPKCGLLVDYDDPAEAKTCTVCGSDEPLFVYNRTYPPIPTSDPVIAVRRTELWPGGPQRGQGARESEMGHP